MMMSILFLWVFGNQAGVPVPVVPALLAAGALAGTAGDLTGILVLAVGATRCADLAWYSFGRWRGARALDWLRRFRWANAAMNRTASVSSTRQIAHPGECAVPAGGEPDCRWAGGGDRNDSRMPSAARARNGCHLGRNVDRNRLRSRRDGYLRPGRRGAERGISVRRNRTTGPSDTTGGRARPSGGRAVTPRRTHETVPGGLGQRGSGVSGDGASRFASSAIRWSRIW